MGLCLFSYLFAVTAGLWCFAAGVLYEATYLIPLSPLCMGLVVGKGGTQ